MGWDTEARVGQLEPIADWRTWVIIADRGWGKTRVLAEAAVKMAKVPGSVIAVIEPFTHDSSAALWSEINRVAPSARLEPAGRKLVFQNGSRAMLFNARDRWQDELRGLSVDGVVADRVSDWPEPIGIQWAPQSKNGRLIVASEWAPVVPDLLLALKNDRAGDLALTASVSPAQEDITGSIRARGAEDTEFAIGDVVALRSGGPAMTISDIDGTTAACCWFREHSAEPSGGRFPVSVLWRAVRSQEAK